MLSLIALPIPLGLALVALIGYAFGKRTRTRLTRAEQKLQRILAETFGRNRNNDQFLEDDETEEVIRDLGQISDRVRRSLAAHHASILRFHERVRQFKQEPNQCDLDELTEEAERMIQPTERLSHQIAHAYDELRQKTKRREESAV